MVDRSNPFEDIERFFERMNRSFGDVAMAPGLHDVAVDVAETDDEVVVTADLPGFEREEITVSLSGRDLTIEAEREEHVEETDEGGEDEVRYVRRERSRRELSRTVRLPDAVVESEATASYTNGVLTVTLPRETAEGDGDSHTIDID
jgi:HSP20 family protein